MKQKTRERRALAAERRRRADAAYRATLGVDTDLPNKIGQAASSGSGRKGLGPARSAAEAEAREERRCAAHFGKSTKGWGCSVRAIASGLPTLGKH